jgi:hypothetical protein
LDEADTLGAFCGKTVTPLLEMFARFDFAGKIATSVTPTALVFQQLPLTFAQGFFCRNNDLCTMRAAGPQICTTAMNRQPTK